MLEKNALIVPSEEFKNMLLSIGKRAKIIRNNLNFKVNNMLLSFNHKRAKAKYGL
jgi:hypothetical protein